MKGLHNSQKGLTHVLPLLIAAVGVISFLLISSVLPLNSLFGVLNPKPSSQAATNQIYWGAWIEATIYGTNPATGAPYDTVPFDCKNTTTCPTWDLFESHAGKATSVEHFGFGKCWNGACQFNDKVTNLNAVVARGNIPILDWATWGRNDRDVATNAKGDDPWITTWAQQAKAWGHPFFLRLDWEMNGCWFDWGFTGPAGCRTSNQPASSSGADFIAMWRHIHDIFVAQGANNVTWVWCPNNESASVATSPTNPSDWVGNAADWYPGDAYVDWTCFDAYNAGGNGWETWDHAAQPIYNHLLQISPSKPIMVGETAANEVGTPPAGQSKATWITDVLTNLPTKYPKIKAYVWFNWLNPTQFPIESSIASQTAFAQGIANPYYATNIFATPPLDANGKILPPTPISSPSPSPTPIPPNTAVLNPVADTYIASDCPTCSTSIGTAPYLYTDASSIHIRNTFIRYDLTSAAGKTLTSVVLRIHTTADSWAGSLGTQNVQYVNDNGWSEQFMSWNNTISPNAILSPPIGSFTGTTQIDTSYDIPLSIANTQSHLGGLYSITISSPSNDNLTFGSRESANPAQLILTFSSCPKGPLGDTDCNGVIDIQDYNNVFTDFNKSGSGILGDVDKNGIVDIQDYNAVFTNFGK